MAMNQAPFAYTTQRLGESPSFLSVSQWEKQILGSSTLHRMSWRPLASQASLRCDTNVMPGTIAMVGAAMEALMKQILCIPICTRLEFRISILIGDCSSEYQL